jgi:hypothetical protein
VGVGLQINRTVVFAAADDPFTDTTLPGVLLGEVAFFRSEADGPVFGLDLTHLFTGRSLENDRVGLAYIGAVCDEAYGSVLSQDFSTLNRDAVLVAAHEIGHALGAPHDGEAGAGCAAEPEGYIMSPDSRRELGLQYSDCSKTQMASVISTAACLDSR